MSEPIIKQVSREHCYILTAEGGNWLATTRPLYAEAVRAAIAKQAEEKFGASANTTVISEEKA